MTVLDLQALEVADERIDGRIDPGGDSTLSLLLCSNADPRPALDRQTVSPRR